MQVPIKVKNAHEATALLRALDDPAARALIVVLGALVSLPTTRARRRVLAHACDLVAEQAQAVRAEED